MKSSTQLSGREGTIRPTGPVYIDEYLRGQKEPTNLAIDYVQPEFCEDPACDPVNTIMPTALPTAEAAVLSENELQEAKPWVKRTARYFLGVPWVVATALLVFFFFKVFLEVLAGKTDASGLVVCAIIAPVVHFGWRLSRHILMNTSSKLPPKKSQGGQV